MNNYSDIHSIHTVWTDFSIDDLRNCEVRQISDFQYQVAIHHKIYEVHLDHMNEVFRKFNFQLDQEHIEVNLIRHIDQLIQNMGFNQSIHTWIDELIAPMPGLVKKILVANQDNVTMGQNLIILEAMKMENVIKSPQSGTIRRIEVVEHQTVDKSQLLIKFES